MACDRLCSTASGPHLPPPSAAAAYIAQEHGAEVPYLGPRSRSGERTSAKPKNARHPSISWRSSLHLPFPTPIGVCQPRLDLCRKVLRAPDDQLQFGVQAGFFSNLLALGFRVSGPLVERGEPGPELRLFNEPLGVTVNQPRQPLPHLTKLALDGGDGCALGPCLGMHPAPVFLRQPLGVGQQRTDFLPQRQLKYVRSHLGIVTNRRAPKDDPGRILLVEQQGMSGYDQHNNHSRDFVSHLDARAQGRPDREAERAFPAAPDCVKSRPLENTTQ
jgi:hypothetical protein